MSLQATDDLLRAALQENAEPSPALLGRVRAAITQPTPPRRAAPRVRCLHIAAAVLAAALALGTTVYAAAQILSGTQVAALWGDDKLARAFAESGLTVSDTQECGEYRVTLTQVVQGRELSSLPLFAQAASDDTAMQSQLHVALAIERVDGAPMTLEGGFSYWIAPLVKGYAPWQVSLADRSAARIAEREGVLYVLFACDDLAVYAQLGLYLLVAQAPPSGELLAFDSNTGEIALQPDAQNAMLFTLPIPAQYGDTEKAVAALTQQKAGAPPAQAGDKFAFLENAGDAPPPEVQVSAFWEDATVLEDTRKPFVPNEDGICCYDCDESVKPEKPEPLGVRMSQSIVDVLELHIPPEQSIIVKLVRQGDVYKAVVLERDAAGAVTSAVVLEKAA